MPYEPTALWLLTALCDAMALAGQSWPVVEQHGAWPRHWLQHRLRRWLRRAAICRQRIGQPWQAWGWE
ncbi:MAG: hypothetical protein K6U14_10835 [Firmicutes bacterium]|nr:hypothetical protein [Alicyclobacillaceae bacterium]MCL6498107.1 hypothetical protein [Bacillota bacterium]